MATQLAGLTKRLGIYLRQRLVELDGLLRGDTTRPEAIAGSELPVSARGLAILAVLLAMFYGACMGSFSLLKETPDSVVDPGGRYWQVVATTIKTPALFFLTLVVTLPSLYVSNALIGSRLTLLAMARLLVASIAVNVAVLASLGTIVLFFSLTTTSHPFILLLNVAAFTVAGVLGLMFLLQTLHRVISRDGSAKAAAAPPATTPTSEQEDQQPPIAEASSDASPSDYDGDGDEPAPASPPRPSAIDMPEGETLGLHTQTVFRCWIVLFSLVGVQMGWVLRPFIGHPDLPFSWFRERDSNFFAAVLGALYKLLGGS